jgi:hypothetical protein
MRDIVLVALLATLTFAADMTDYVNSLPDCDRL